MSLESDAIPEHEPRDYTKWIWLGVIALVIAAGVILWVANTNRRWTRSQVRARHILIQYDPNDPTSRQEAFEHIHELRDRLLAGESFEKLAREHSDDTYSRARGGDLGYHPKGEFDDAVEAYVWQAPLEEVSPVVTSSHGFHVIEVLDRYLTDADAYEFQLQRELDQEAQQEVPSEEPAAEEPAS